MAGVSLGRLPTLIGAVERWNVRFASGKSCSPLLRFSFTAGRRAVFPDKQPIAESLHSRGRRNGNTGQDGVACSGQAALVRIRVWNPVLWEIIIVNLPGGARFGGRLLFPKRTFWLWLPVQQDRCELEVERRDRWAGPMVADLA